jgi:glyoxylase I family protein
VRIDHVVLWVEDVERALAFYRDVVGLEPVRADEFRRGEAPFPSVRVAAGSLLDLMSRAGAEPVRLFTGETVPSAAGQPINHVCLAMDGGEIEALRARLAARRIPISESPVPSFGARGLSARSFYFQDPDGNVLEARDYPP